MDEDGQDQSNYFRNVTDVVIVVSKRGLHIICPCKVAICTVKNISGDEECRAHQIILVVEQDDTGETKEQGHCGYHVWCVVERSEDSCIKPFCNVNYNIVKRILFIPCNFSTNRYVHRYMKDSKKFVKRNVFYPQKWMG